MFTKYFCAGVAIMMLATGCPALESVQSQLPSHCRPVSIPDGGISEPPGVNNEPGQDGGDQTPAEPSTGNDNYVMVDFTNAAHRATLTEDGLEFVMADGPWAIYRVTTQTPRIYIPGVIEPDHSFIERHRTALCISSQYFTSDADPTSAHVKLMGSVGESETPQQLVVRGATAYAFGQCTGATDMRTEPDGTQQVTDLYIELDPAPAIGSLVPLMMVVIGSYDSALELPHPNEQWRVCCPDETRCEAEEPPGWSDPPDEPPAGNEPPGGSGPPNEPPGVSSPPSECPPGYEDTRVIVGLSEADFTAFTSSYN